MTHIRKISHGTIGPASVQRALIGRKRKFLAVSFDSTDASSAVEDDGTFAAFLDICEEDAHRQLAPFSLPKVVMPQSTHRCWKKSCIMKHVCLLK